MSKKTVKRCIRPQCMVVYSLESKNKYCGCGADLHEVEIETPNGFDHKPEKKTVRSTGASSSNKPDRRIVPTVVENTGPSVKPEPTGYLYLIPENEDEDEEEIAFKLGRRTLIGRSSDPVTVDVDLSQFGRVISRKHALITCETDGFYITNLSENHSVHVNKKVVIKGQRMKLTSEDGIILSKIVLLQFKEVE